MIPVGYVDTAPAAHLPFVAVIEVLDAVQIVQVPEGRSMFTVDF